MQGDCSLNLPVVVTGIRDPEISLARNFIYPEFILNEPLSFKDSDSLDTVNDNQPSFISLSINWN